LDPIVISGDSYVAEIKKQLYDRLLEIGYVSNSWCLNYKFIRLREKGGVKPDRILRDEKTIQQCCILLFEGKTMCFEILDHSEDLGSEDIGDIVVLVQKWQRVDWTLSEPPIEVYLYGSWNIRDIAIGLGHLFQIKPEIMKALIVFGQTDIHLCYLNDAVPRNTSDAW
jgi:hypothetical protein